MTTVTITDSDGEITQILQFLFRNRLTSRMFKTITNSVCDDLSGDYGYFPPLNICIQTSCSTLNLEAHRILLFGDIHAVIWRLPPAPNWHPVYLHRLPREEVTP